MTPEERRFLRSVYAKMEQKEKRRGRWIGAALGAVGIVLLAVACLAVHERMVRFLLVGTLVLTLLCAIDWVRQGATKRHGSENRL